MAPCRFFMPTRPQQALPKGGNGHALGIHARPAGQIARFVKANAARATVQVEKAGGASADAQRVMALMRLGAKPGDALHITVDGPEADAVASELRQLLEQEKL